MWFKDAHSDNLGQDYGQIMRMKRGFEQNLDKIQDWQWRSLSSIELGGSS